MLCFYICPRGWQEQYYKPAVLLSEEPVRITEPTLQQYGLLLKAHKALLKKQSVLSFIR